MRAWVWNDNIQDSPRRSSHLGDLDRKYRDWSLAQDTAKGELSRRGRRGTTSLTSNGEAEMGPVLTETSDTGGGGQLPDSIEADEASFDAECLEDCPCPMPTLHGAGVSMPRYLPMSIEVPSVENLKGSPQTSLQ
ncbi:UNVERIFIED_CONTAM: hypothetical protein K2H54_027438 [Gekko kuhli]